MYAVIQTGGKQYRVEPGKTIHVEKLDGEAGAKIVFDQVLLVSSGDGATVNIGKPIVAGAKVVGEIVEQTRAKKLIVFKMEYARNYVRKNGHRQDLTAVKISAIEG
jgi:large subunit ribosomal protein L21